MMFSKTCILFVSFHYVSFHYCLHTFIDPALLVSYWWQKQQ